MSKGKKAASAASGDNPKGSRAVRGPRTDWDVLRDAFAEIRETTSTWAFGEPVVASFGTDDRLWAIARGGRKSSILWFYEMDAKAATVDGSLNLSFRSEPLDPDPGELRTLQEKAREAAEDLISHILFDFGFDAKWDGLLGANHSDHLLVVQGKWD